MGEQFVRGKVIDYDARGRVQGIITIQTTKPAERALQSPFLSNSVPFPKELFPFFRSANRVELKYPSSFESLTDRLPKSKLCFVPYRTVGPMKPRMSDGAKRNVKRILT